MLSVLYCIVFLWNMASNCSVRWVTVCKTVRPKLQDRCLSVLSVTLVYCCQRVGWITMKLGMEVDIRPGHIVLHGDAAPPKGTQPSSLRPVSVVVKRLDGSIETWHGGRPRPRQHCVRWGPSSPPPKDTAPQIFGTCLPWPNDWMYQNTTWYGGRPCLGHIVLDWDAAPQGAQQPQFLAHVYCGQTVTHLSDCL